MKTNVNSSSRREVVEARNVKHEQSKSEASGQNVTTMFSKSSNRGNESRKIQKGSSKSVGEVVDLVSSDSSDDGGIDI